MGSPAARREVKVAPGVNALGHFAGDQAVVQCGLLETLQRSRGSNSESSQRRSSEDKVMLKDWYTFSDHVK